MSELLTSSNAKIHSGDAKVLEQLVSSLRGRLHADATRQFLSIDNPEEFIARMERAQETIERIDHIGWIALHAVYVLLRKPENADKQTIPLNRETFILLERLETQLTLEELSWGAITLQERMTNEGFILDPDPWEGLGSVHLPNPPAKPSLHK